MITRRSLLCGSLAAAATAAAGPKFDLIIRNGTIIDGTRRQRYKGDLAISGSRIAAIARQLPARATATVIDATGKIVAPGFIDNHAHLVTLESHPLAENFLRQGITTIFATLHSQDQAWPMAAYRERVKMAPNVGLFAGHTWIRKRVMALANRAPSAEELDRMRALVRQSMEEGALGLASGLEYVPANYAKTEELIELAKEIAPFGGYYATHMRDEGPGLLDAVDEALRIGREARVPVLINHLKATGASQFGWTKRAMDRIDSAVKRGQRVAFDAYPYTAFSTYADVMFPSWALADGPDAFAKRTADPATRQRLVKEMIRLFPEQAGAGPDSIQLPGGKTLAVYLADHGRPSTIPEAAEALIELQRKGGFIGVFHAMSEEDVRAVLAHPRAMFESDGDLVDPASGAFPHPRSYGAFPRVLAKYVREEKLLTLEAAIHKMTALPAQWWGLSDRGTLKAGMQADAVIFDAPAVRDVATYTDPNHYSEGIEHVIVNGTVALSAGKMTGAKPGHFLTRPAAITRRVKQ